MITREQIIEKSREYIGTKYHKQGRLKKTEEDQGGIDCCGLLICVAKELGLTDYDIEGYSDQPDGVSLLKEFNSQCTPVKIPEPGDILIFRIRHFPQHCGIMSQIGGHAGVIHAYQSVGTVREHILHDWWLCRVVAAYKFPGLD